MSSDWSAFISRDELIGGLPARWVSTLLFAIESRTANLVARSRQAMARFQTEKSAEENERAFLEAMAQGRDEGPRTTIQDLERFAPRWADLVPPEPNLRAAIARMVGAKYLLPRPSVPAIQTALGLDDPAVAQAFARLHGQPLDSIYALTIPWRERLHWVRIRVSQHLESMPPF